MTIKKHIKGVDDEKDKYDRIRERSQKRNRYRKQSKRLRTEQYSDYDGGE